MLEGQSRCFISFDIVVFSTGLRLCHHRDLKSHAIREDQLVDPKKGLITRCQ
jgi:hypothetical protein